MSDLPEVSRPASGQSGHLLVDRAFNLDYRKELDGLRCIAVVLVLLFHGAKSWMPGGWVGVDIFFVLSGFLITALLLAEFREFGKINLKAFYVRRALRLFPALYSMLAAAFIFSLFLPEPHKTTIRGEIVAAGLHIWNYGAKLGFWQADTTWLYHTWSLSTEEQFYLVWPLMFSLFLLKRIRQRTALLMTAGLYISLSAYATILVGCALAMMYPTQLSQRATRQLSLTAACAAVYLGYVALTSPETTAPTRGIIALASATVILYLMHNPNGKVSSLLSSRMPVFIGKISYGIYLWHLLVFKILYFSWGTVPSAYHKPVFFVKIAASFAVALMSYYLIELPFLKLKKRFKRSPSTSQT